jgi:RNA polymerase sigma factor (sigma-70 family)
MAGPGTTDSLLENALSGDEDAFNTLHQRFSSRLESYVQSRLRGRTTAAVGADDIVQEVFAEVFTRIARVERRGKGTFYRLLLTIARRRLIDLDRRLAAREGGATAAGSGSDWAAGPSTGPLTRLLRAEERDLCRQAFEGLPESYRRIIWLRLVEERGAAEIGKLTGRSVGAVWVWFHRALKAWHERFERMREE